MRLFAGVPLAAGLVDDYARLQRDLAGLAGLEGVKWVEPRNLHLTLAFLGHVEVSRVPEICAALQRAAPGAWGRASAGARERAAAGVREEAGVALRALRLTGFPSARAARVLVVELEDRAGALAALQTEVRAALEPLGFAPEDRPFRCHVTLGRVRRGTIDARAALERLAPPAGEWEVTAFSLLESRLGREGPTYSAVRSFALG